MTNPVPTDPVPGPRAPTSTPPRWASSATRHLAAGAYLDDRFRRDCLREVYHQRLRLVAPSYGFDLVTVLGHCLEANRLAVYRDAAVLGGLLFVLCISPWGVAYAIALLAVLHLASSAWGILQDVGQAVRQGSAADIMNRTMGAGLRLLGAAALLVVIAFSTRLMTRQVDPAFEPVEGLIGATAGQITLGALGTLLLTIGASVGATIVRERELAQFAPDGKPRPFESPARLAEIRRQGAGNTVVFAGYRPFVGSGVPIKNWGFAQRLVHAGDPLTGLAPEAEREFRDVPFTARELLTHLRDGLAALTTEQEAEHQLPGLTVTERVFLAGTEVTRLDTHTPPERVDEIVRSPVAPARHYLVCQVVSWHGELVTTVYVHVAVQARSLYVEFTSTALLPCHQQFRQIDQVTATGAFTYLRPALQGIVDTPTALVRAPIGLLGAGLDAITNSPRLRSAATLIPGYDHGAGVSVRELGMAGGTRHHIQTQEIDKHQRIIERRLLAAILDFLEGRGVDTSEYRQRAATLLNAGAIVSGGSLTVHGDLRNAQTNTVQSGGAGR